MHSKNFFSCFPGFLSLPPPKKIAPDLALWTLEQASIGAKDPRIHAIEFKQCVVMLSLLERHIPRLRSTRITIARRHLSPRNLPPNGTIFPSPFPLTRPPQFSAPASPPEDS